MSEFECNTNLFDHVKSIDGTPTMKLVAVLIANGITKISDLVAATGLKRRAIFVAKSQLKLRRSATECTTKGASECTKGATHCTNGAMECTHSAMECTGATDYTGGATECTVQDESPLLPPPLAKKEKVPPKTPLKEKNSTPPPNYPPQSRSKKQVLAESYPFKQRDYVDQLNGSADLIINSLAAWSGLDLSAAEKNLSDKIALHGADIVKTAFGRLQSRIDQGRSVEKPWVILGFICEDVKKEKAEAGQWKVTRW